MVKTYLDSTNSIPYKNSRKEIVAKKSQKATGKVHYRNSIVVVVIVSKI